MCRFASYSKQNLFCPFGVVIHQYSLLAVVGIGGVVVVAGIRRKSMIPPKKILDGQREEGHGHGVVHNVQ